MGSGVQRRFASFDVAVVAAFRAGGAESESSVERSTSHFQAESARCRDCY